jgi:hypothetical protein
MCKVNKQSNGEKAASKSRRSLTPEMKLQIFLEAQRGDKPVGDLIPTGGY